MKITVLMHEGHPLRDSPRYLIEELSVIWREHAHEVAEVCGVRGPIHGDVVIVHVDATVVPQKYLAAVAGHPRVVNRRGVDISKTLYSRLRVYSPEDWDGPVIVKTVRNSGGHPDRRLARTKLLGRLLDIAQGRLGALSLAYASWLDDYPIFDSAKDVPRGVFRNRALFVERFLPERSGEFYCFRTYRFLGKCSNTTLNNATHLSGKRRRVVSREEYIVHDAIAAAREQMGLDYGKLDYVLHDGEPVLLDVSRTPGLTTIISPEWQRRYAEALAPGIESFFA